MNVHLPALRGGDAPCAEPGARAAEPAVVLPVLALTVTLLAVLTIPSATPARAETPAAPVAPAALRAPAVQPAVAASSETRAEVQAEADALELLGWAASARSRVGFTGVQFLSTWSANGTSSFVVDVDHVAGGGTTVHVRGTSTGPEGVSMTVGAGDDAVGATGLDQVSTADLALLGSNYDVAVRGRAGVVGREAAVVVASRDGREAARFWVDLETGLLLRREVYDERGTTIRASAFIDLRPARQGFLRQMPPPMPAPWGTQAGAADVSALRDDGWNCPDALAGSLELRQARVLDSDGGDGGAGEIVHLSYSDGLSSVSVFEQRGHLDVERLDGYRAKTSDAWHGPVYVDEGLPQRFVWSAEGTVYTVIADAPSETIHEVIASLPHTQEDDGALPRIRRGMDRVASWFNPFG